MLIQSQQQPSSPLPSGRQLRFSTVLAGAAGVALALLLGSSPAQARDLNWSVGISSPGVVVGVGNGGYANYGGYGGYRYAPPPRYYSAPPGYYAPPPVYYAPPPPVYYQPRPVYVAPPQVYYAPAPRPIYYAPAVPVQRPYYGPGWRGQRHGDRHHGYGYRD